MKRTIIFALAACLCAALNASEVSYTADEALFSNPERGFITMLEEHLSAESPYAVKGEESTLDEKKASENMSIVLVHYYLDNYKTEALPEAILNAFDEDMAVLRSKGMKAILRFSYTDTPSHLDPTDESSPESAADATKEIVLQHIAQYASHWQANADVIFTFQAGFIGAWGEWYYTDHFGNKGSVMNDDRRAVVDALLAAVPSDRCIQLRTPLFKTGYVGSTEALTAEEAYSGSAKARLGHHNDAFLSSTTDMGTYSDPQTQKPYIAQETLYVPLGGETNIEDKEEAPERASYENTTTEMSNLHWTFIQSGYSTVVTDMWRTNGTFDELNKRLGYRFELVSGSFSDEVQAGETMSVQLQIRNSGYAPLYNERPAYIILKNGETSFRFAMDADPRTWLPNGAVSTVSESLAIPANVPAGTYDLYLYLPDHYSSIADNPAYAVRFANTGVWESSTGMNSLNAQVTVTLKKTIEARQDPANEGVYYSTFYDSSVKYVLPAGVEAYTATISGTDLYLTKIAEAGQTIPADNAVILKYTTVSAEAELSYILVPSEAEAESAPENNVLQGVDEDTDTPDEPCYVLSGGENGVGFYRYTGETLHAHKAYVIYSGQINAPRHMPFVFDVATDVENVQSDKAQCTKVIKDGQLYLMYKGQMYNVQGKVTK